MTNSHEPKPYSFFASNNVSLANYSANDLVLVSDPIPSNHWAKLTDLNTMFTTAGGTIQYEILHKSGGSTIFAKDRTANDNGSFNTGLLPGDKLAIRITATGNGVLDVLWHGEIKQVKEIDDSDKFQPGEFDFILNGGI